MPTLFPVPPRSHKYRIHPQHMCVNLRLLPQHLTKKRNKTKQVAVRRAKKAQKSAHAGVIGPPYTHTHTHYSGCARDSSGSGGPAGETRGESSPRERATCRHQAAAPGSRPARSPGLAPPCPCARCSPRVSSRHNLYYIYDDETTCLAPRVLLRPVLFSACV